MRNYITYCLTFARSGRAHNLRLTRVRRGSEGEAGRARGRNGLEIAMTQSTGTRSPTVVHGFDERLLNLGVFAVHTTRANIHNEREG